MTAVDPIKKTIRSVSVIVAHPDDETLWAGGTMLSHAQWDCFVVSLCRAGDKDRAPKFLKILQAYGAAGIMGDLDDGPEQTPLPDETVEQAILKLLPAKHYDLIITHHPRGEYTRHLRHEEVSRAVINLWYRRQILADELWVFAYEDGGRAYYPKAVDSAAIYYVLPKDIWQKKYALMTGIYGFKEDSWEAQTTPASESFWCFEHPEEAYHWLNNKEI
jgi:LmbE family N-acetylglucosaminyl deacetylase